MRSDTSPGPTAPDPPTSPGTSAVWQTVARVAAATALVLIALWVLEEFFAALVWAAVLAIALWPLYHRMVLLMPERREREIAPALATVAITIVLIAPLVLLGMAVARESHFVIGFISDARHHGIPVPGWVGALPFVGASIDEWWQANLSDPVAAGDLIGQVNLRNLAESARAYGGEIVHRIVILLFTLLTLFFLFRDGDRLAVQLRELSDRVIGLRGERIARHMVAAVHGTVNGLVLVGLGEGFLLGICYFAVGLPYPASFGAVTAVAAVIPFAAPVVYSLAGLYLLAVGNTVGGIVVIVFGSVLVFIADHFIRPFLIGGAARLPFLLVLLGLLGGLRTMGFLGLFLGPAIMAALVALWREWTEPPLSPESVAARARRGNPRRVQRRTAGAELGRSPPR
ncbi:MAG TPA: AI-2E family transporter [Stellaceae bacterium]